MVIHSVVWNCVWITSKWCGCACCAAATYRLCVEVTSIMMFCAPVITAMIDRQDNRDDGRKFPTSTGQDARSNVVYLHSVE